MAQEATARASSPPGYRRSRVRCARCGSVELHRSRPRGAAERLLTGLTPFGSYRCPACGKRALHLGEVAVADPQAGAPPAQGRKRRPSRTRDSLRSFGLAVGLGLGLGLLLIKTFAR